MHEAITLHITGYIAPNSYLGMDSNYYIRTQQIKILISKYILQFESNKLLLKFMKFKPIILLSMSLTMKPVDVRYSPQTNLWKRLRLLKKCIYCRSNKQFKQLIINCLQDCDHSQGILKKLTQSMIINFLIHRRIPQSIYIKNQCPPCKYSMVRKYYCFENSQKEIKELAFYYRYYEQKPLIIAGKVFQLISSYRVKRKMIQYQKIKTMYSPQKSTNRSSKLKANVHKSEQLLNFIQETHYNITSSSVDIAEKLGFASRKTVQQIDSQYCFNQKFQNKQIKFRLNALKIKQKADSVKKTPVNKRINKKHHKSCGNIYSQSKRDIKTSKDKRKKTCMTQNQKKKQMELYIINLKRKIEKEKKDLYEASIPKKRKNKKKEKTMIKIITENLSERKQRSVLKTLKSVKKKLPNKYKKKEKLALNHF